MSVDVSRQRDVIQEAREVLSHHAKSFRLAAIFLPKSKANDAAIVYQFCRELDDAVDEAPSLEVAKQEVSRLRAELCGDAAPSPAVRSYLAVAERLQIPDFVAYDLLEGVASDLNDVVIKNKI